MWTRGRFFKRWRERKFSAGGRGGGRGGGIVSVAEDVGRTNYTYPCQL